jgi:hypothetical protein
MRIRRVHRDVPVRPSNVDIARALGSTGNDVPAMNAMIARKIAQMS